MIFISALTKASATLGAIALLTTALPANAINFTASSSGTTTINAGGSGQINVTFDAGLTPLIVDGVTFNFSSVTTSLGGDFGELTFSLTSPTTKRLVLLGAGTAVGFNQFTNVTFSDNATFNVSDFTQPTLVNATVLADGSGSSTIGNFAGFNSDITFGNQTWILSVDNGSATDNVTFGSVTLNVSAVPFEFDGSAGMAIVGGAFVLNRWYKKRKSSDK
jgi:hypothetical protein